MIILKIYGKYLPYILKVSKNNVRRKMARALIITRDADSREELRKTLSYNDITFLFITYSNGFRQEITAKQPEVLLLEMGEQLPGPETQEIIRKVKKEKRVPVIALIPREYLDKMDANPDIDDFLVTPYDVQELVIRINRLLGSRGPESQEPIQGPGLTIDPDTCEVTVDGSKVELTFKEYELLKLLASHKGRVFTREVLLDKIWGYDYYGGDRTVDVHIRRLRSKIEQNRGYIETVRNIGYRFVKDS
jgi:two-component system alkaline phosphatase synthesis response regulator PhoP